MKTKAAEELAAAPVRWPCGKVLESLHEHWTGLTRFVDDARIPMDHNTSERRLRGPALGRKNYYGSKALGSGKLARMLFSLFATREKWGIHPRRWLRWYLDSWAVHGGKPPANVEPFLPWNMSPEQRESLSEGSGRKDAPEPANSS